MHMMTEKEARNYWKAVLKNTQERVHRYAIAKMELEHLENLKEAERTFKGIKKA